MVTWDVNVLLSYFEKKGKNSELRINELAGKVLLLVMLSQMCHLGEVMQLQASKMEIWGNKRKFTLEKPTKTYNSKTFKVLRRDHQIFEIQTFPHNELLCPVKAIDDYIEMTKPYRPDDMDDLFILVTVQKLWAATRQTLSRWGKEWLTQACLGTTVSSIRSASTTSALLMGVSLDEILSRVAWLQVSTFVDFYLKPMPVPRSSQLTKKVGPPVKISMSYMTHICSANSGTLIICKPGPG